MLKRTLGRGLAALVAMAALSVGAHAQESVEVATGGKTGNYTKVFADINRFCGREVALTERNTTGSEESLTLLTGNQVNMAIVQTDVLFLRQQSEDLGDIKALFTLYPEDLHFIARGSKKEGGYFGTDIGAKTKTFDRVEDLAGRKVAAVGGSITSARIFAQKAGLNFQIVTTYKDNPAAKQALLNGEVDGLIMVGGAGMADVASLDGNQFKLLSVSPELQKKVASVYKPTMQRYLNLNGGNGVNTVSIDPVLVVYNYKSPAKVQQINAFKSCFEKQLPTIKESKGTYPAWRKITLDNKPKWPTYGS